MKGRRARGPPGPGSAQHHQWPRRAVLGEAAGRLRRAEPRQEKGPERPGLRKRDPKVLAGAGEVLRKAVWTGMSREAGGEPAWGTLELGGRCEL